MRNLCGVSRILLVGIIVVLIIVAAAAFMLLPKGPPQPTTTTTTAKLTTTEMTPTTTSKTASSATSLTATKTTAITPETTTKPTETVETTSTATLPEIGYVTPQNMKDLVVVATSMTYRWTSDAEVWRYSYEVLNEETVEGVATWKIKIEFANEETQNFTIWVSQVDGVAKQAEFDGTTVTGEMLKSFQAMLGALMLPLTVFGGYNWAWREYWNLPSDVGVVTYEGSQPQTFGPTTLTVDRFKFVPNPLYEPAKDMNYVEWNFAKTGNLGIATHFKGENKEGEVFAFDLVSVTLAPAVLSG